MTLFQTVAAAMNVVVRPLVRSSWFRPLVGDQLTTLTYTGPRSGRTFTIPVGYARDGDRVTVGVMLPDQKTWWRNFRGAGRSLSLHLDGAERTGHGVATRDADGQVSVAITLDAAETPGSSTDAGGEA